MRLREITAGEPGPSKSADTIKGKHRDWLPLLLRETLGKSRAFPP